MAWTSPRTWISGEVVTAALLNTHVRDNLLAIGDPGAWTAFTPVLTQTAGVAISSNSSAWKAVGKVIHVRYLFSVNGAGTAGGAMTVSVPTAAVSAGALQTSGWLLYQDVTGASVAYNLIPTASTTGAFTMMHVGPGTFFGNNPGVTAAVGDSFSGSITYEAA